MISSIRPAGPAYRLQRPAASPPSDEAPASAGAEDSRPLLDAARSLFHPSTTAALRARTECAAEPLLTDRLAGWKVPLIWAQPKGEGPRRFRTVALDGQGSRVLVIPGVSYAGHSGEKYGKVVVVDAVHGPISRVDLPLPPDPTDLVVQASPDGEKVYVWPDSLDNRVFIATPSSQQEMTLDVGSRAPGSIKRIFAGRHNLYVACAQNATGPKSRVTLLAYDPVTGSHRWSRVYSDHAWNVAGLTELPDGSVYLGTCHGPDGKTALQVLSPQGEPIHSLPLDHYGGDDIYPGVGGKVVFSGISGMECYDLKRKRGLGELFGQPGRHLWSRPSHYSEPFRSAEVQPAQDQLVMGSPTDGRMVCVGAATGEEKWADSVPGLVGFRVFPDHIAVANRVDEGLRLRHLSLDGAPVWQATLPFQPAQTGPLVIDEQGHFLVGGSDGNFYCVHPRTAADNREQIASELQSLPLDILTPLEEPGVGTIQKADDHVSVAGIVVRRRAEP